MASRYADIPALNHLIDVLLDATRLYRRALALAKQGGAADTIAATLHERTVLLAELQQRVRTLGGRPPTEATMMGRAHNAMLSMRVMFDRDVAGALAAVERGEAYLRDEIRKSMRREDLSAETRAFLGIALDRAVTGEPAVEEVPAAATAEPRAETRPH